VPLRVITALLFALPLAARALCTSDAVAQPQAVLERFVSADCEACWRDPATPRLGAGALALDWVLPGRRGEDAPLSAGAIPEARERLQSLGAPNPARMAAVSRPRSGSAVPLRVALGQAFNDYIGASIELAPTGGEEAWRAWLLLVESLPAGTEGSPVARNLVRGVFRPDWGQPAAAGGRLAETRSMQVREGTLPERLRLVGLLEDARGQLRAISQTECP
jgi:hypothetical protein